MTVILTVLAIGALIVIHELGHLLVAKKWTGLPATQFSIGMGPVIWKKDAWGVSAAGGPHI